MGDKNRFKIFSELIAGRFDRQNKIADIAGGKGYLQIELRKNGFQDVATYDLQLNTKRREVIEYHCYLFEEKMAANYDVLVGLHPDKATDLIISSAAKNKKSFAVIPCCVMANIIPFVRGKKIPHKSKFELWDEHLIQYAQKLNFKVEVQKLPFSGRNTAIIGTLSS